MPFVNLYLVNDEVRAGCPKLGHTTLLLRDEVEGLCRGRDKGNLLHQILTTNTSKKETRNIEELSPSVMRKIIYRLMLIYKLTVLQIGRLSFFSLKKNWALNTMLH